MNGGYSTLRQRINLFNFYKFIILFPNINYINIYSYLRSEHTQSLYWPIYQVCVHEYVHNVKYSNMLLKIKY